MLKPRLLRRPGDERENRELSKTGTGNAAVPVHRFTGMANSHLSYSLYYLSVTSLEMGGCGAVEKVGF